MTRSMKPTMPQTAPGSRREALPLSVPRPSELLPNFAEAQREADELALRNAVRAAVNSFGGPDALRAALGEKPTYLSKISEALTGDRPVQAHWLIPLLTDPKSGPIIRAHFDQVSQRDELPEDDLASEALAFLRDNPAIGAIARPWIAGRRGIQAARVRL